MEGACNPPDKDGTCVQKEPAISGSSDMNYDVDQCGYNKDAKDKGNINDIWGEGPKLSGAKFFE